MTVNTGDKKKGEDRHSVDVDSKGRLIKALKNRNLVLEKALQTTREDLRARVDELRRKNDALEGQIRERERAGQALHESEERFRILADDAPVLIWVNGLEGGEYVNRAYLEFLGVSGHVDIQRYDWSQYVHPDDREGYLNRYLDCFRLMAPFEAQFRFRRYDGAYRWMKSVGRPRFTSAGGFLGYVGSTQDITELKLMEDELRKARDELELKVEQRTNELRQREARLSVAQRMAKLGSWSYDIKNDRNYWSDELYQMLGLAHDKPFMSISDLLSHIHPEDAIKFGKLYEKALQDKQPYSQDLRFIKPDGSMQYLYTEAYIDCDNNGRPAQVHGYVQDITERKSTEEKFEHVASFPEFNPCPVIEVDDTGNIKYCNPASSHMYPDLKALGMNHPLLKDIEFGHDAIPKAESMQIVRDVEINGVYYQQTILYMPKSKTTRIYCIDITERKRAEEALRRSETGLKKSQEIAHLGSWELDLVNDRLTWSDEVYRIFGLQPQEFGATYEAFLEAVHPDDRVAVDAAYSGSIREGRDTYEIEHRVVRKTTGEVRYVHEKCAHFRDRSRRIIRSVGMVQDITERKRVEEELIAAKQMAELYLDLMGHDINNMHQIAMGYLELARETHATGGQAEFLDKPFEVLQRSARLIKNVRKLQKLRDGAFPTEVIDVCTVLADVHLEFDAMPDRAITLNLNNCEHCYVRANELLHDVFANLVSNAIKHTGDQSDITVDLDVREEDGGRHCLTIVEDNGPGIPDEFKGRIFNRMLHGTDKAKGMGLGLYLVKSLVESYGGRVWVEDRVYGDHTKGARFIVMLPIVDN